MSLRNKVGYVAGIILQNTDFTIKLVKMFQN